MGRAYLRNKILFLTAAFLLLMSGVQLGAKRATDASVSPAAAVAQSSGLDEFGTVFYFPLVMNPYPRFVAENTPLHGVNFISSVESPADEQQYQNGLSTGATWNRWPMYWYGVEQSPDSFNWTAQDIVVQADISHGLRSNVILMGTPGFYVSGFSEAALFAPPTRWRNYLMSAPNASTPQGIYDPVFSDGTDEPGPGKRINEANRWARFVYAAVERYKPGGVLARRNNWPQGVGVTHWEMWNEQDYSFFWSSSLEDYARLLKVGYLATKQADPGAQVLFGGLANFQQPEFLKQVLNIYDADPLASQHGYFFDILATHSYSKVRDAWVYVYRAKLWMSDHGLDKPVWLNETGVPAWDDYPGPVWDPQSSFRATTGEQADFTIQTAFYATWAGADAIFHFQLYDGCGNQPAGTDFPPHYGELCDENGLYNGLPCAGDANGFFRNPTHSACFSQHPQPETPRPKLAALQVLTTYFQDVVPLERKRVGNPNPILAPQEWFVFYRPSTGQRITGLWARFGDDQTAEVPSQSVDGTALLVAPDGTTHSIAANGDGSYVVFLPGATNQNTPWTVESGYPVGGRPVILIESVAN